MPSEESPKAEEVVSAKPKSPMNMTPVYMVIIAVVFLAIGFFASGAMTGAVTAGGSQDAVGAKVADYISANLVQPGETVTISSMKDVGSMYLINISYKNQTIPLYASKDGKYLIPGESFVIDMSAPLPKADTGTDTSATTTTPTDTPKSDKPNVELFVMSYCPYGTQTEKGIIPVVETMKDKIDFSVKFVYYSMHGKTEIDEQTRQYCIEKEQNANYLTYLKCFLNSSNSVQCLLSSGIDKTKLTSCVAAADSEFSITKNFDDKTSWLSGKYPLFDVNKADNEKYSVGGSPTLVINGQEVQSGRDPASLLAAICGAFNTEPSECSTQLSSAQPSTGFGYSASDSASATSAGCST